MRSKTSLTTPPAVSTNEHWVIEVGKFGRVRLPVRSSMNNAFKRRIALVETAALALDVEFEGEFRTQRSLTDFACRERQMRRYRQFLFQAKPQAQKESAKQ